MKQIAVVSGKGGTGKTSITAAFAGIQENLVLADCDVDAADLHLLVGANGKPETAEPFFSSYRAVVDPVRCDSCGRCVEVCRFEAVKLAGDQVAGSAGGGARISEILCEGCGCCVDVCPSDAVELEENHAGELFVSSSRFGPLVHARLKPGEGNTGKLVSMVRSRAEAIAGNGKEGLILVDGSPGIGCPVIASVTGTDAALIVTEPSVSGLHDLERIADLCVHFHIPTYAVINKSDLSLELTGKIEDMCRSRGIAVLGRIPFDPLFIEAMVAGRTVLQYKGSPAVEAIRGIWMAFAENSGIREKTRFHRDGGDKRDKANI